MTLKDQLFIYSASLRVKKYISPSSATHKKYSVSSKQIQEAAARAEQARIDIYTSNQLRIKAQERREFYEARLMYRHNQLRNIISQLRNTELSDYVYMILA